MAPITIAFIVLLVSGYAMEIRSVYFDDRFTRLSSSILLCMCWLVFALRESMKHNWLFLILPIALFVFEIVRARHPQFQRQHAAG